MVTDHVWRFLQTLSKEVIRMLLPYAVSYMKNGSPLDGTCSTYEEFYELLLRPLGLANEGKKYCKEWPSDPVDPVDRVDLSTLRVVDKTRATFWNGVMMYIIDRSKGPKKSNRA